MYMYADASIQCTCVRGEPHSWWIQPRVNSIFWLHVVCTIVTILLYDEHCFCESFVIIPTFMIMLINSCYTTYTSQPYLLATIAI